MVHLYSNFVYSKISADMICLTFLNLYPYVKLLLPTHAENDFGNKIPAKVGTSCVKKLTCRAIYFKCKQLQIPLITDSASVKYEACNYII